MHSGLDRIPRSMSPVHDWHCHQAACTFARWQRPVPPGQGYTPQSKGINKTWTEMHQKGFVTCTTIQLASWIVISKRLPPNAGTIYSSLAHCHPWLRSTMKKYTQQQEQEKEQQEKQEQEQEQQIQQTQQTQQIQQIIQQQQQQQHPSNSKNKSNNPRTALSTIPPPLPLRLSFMGASWCTGPIPCGNKIGPTPWSGATWPSA